MDPISLAGAYQSLKAAKEILGALFDARVDAEARPKILEAQTKLGEIQDALFLLRERLAELQAERDELKQTLNEAESWDRRAGNYELIETQGGAIVYRFRGAPQHFACPSCFHRREVQILQDTRRLAGIYLCTGCKSEFPIRQREEPRFNLPPS
jgi:hypothetical protein